jgi:tetratricopeptide (TPR) repeat protein
MPKAREAVQKALALDDALPEVHALYGYIKTTYEWDWEGAERKFRRALQLNPNNVYVLELYSSICPYALRPVGCDLLGERLDFAIVIPGGNSHAHARFVHAFGSLGESNLQFDFLVGHFSEPKPWPRRRDRSDR